MERQEVIEAPDLKKLTSANLSALIELAQDRKYSIAVWRLPEQSTTHLIISKRVQKLKADVNFEDLNQGFIFAPFDTTRERLYLDADYAFSIVGDLSQPVGNVPKDLLHDLAEHQPKSAERVNKMDQSGQGSDKYINMINLALESIGEGKLDKVVPSRSAFVKLRNDFDIVKAFQQLSASNPNAIISFVSTPESGGWIGASPELLVSVDDGKIFKTIALAGTQPYTTGQDLKSVAWTQKHIEEQALVERYIISCFKLIRLREYDEFGPRTAVAGNLLHLKSEFIVDMQATNLPLLGSMMLRLLHPTSAVCGAPLQAAIEFLKKHEGYDREFYSGYLGPVNYAKQTQIFVNLRCAQFTRDGAVLYAGAGITVDSDAAQEWLETEMKMNTLRGALSGSGTTD